MSHPGTPYCLFHWDEGQTTHTECIYSESKSFISPMCYKNSFLLYVCSLSLCLLMKVLNLNMAKSVNNFLLTFKEPLPHARYSLIFSSKSSDFAFHIKVFHQPWTDICVWERQGPSSNSFFAHGYPAVLAPFLKTSLCSVRLPLSFIKVHVNVGLFLF